MIEILIASLISSVFILGWGNFFSNFFFSKTYSKTLTNSEKGLIGVIFLSFLSLIINFFFPINKFIGTLILIVGIIFYFKNKTYKDFKLIFSSTIVIFILVSYSTVYRPDAGLYHLPIISMIQENKIIIGSSNIHFRFGQASIIQYFSSLYNNFFFEKNFLTISLANIFSFFIYFQFLNIFKFLNENKKSQSLISFLITIVSIYTFNRYSNYGNDAVGHFYFFYLISSIININLKNKNFNDEYYKLILISVFALGNKLFLVLIFIFPIYIFFQIKNKIQIIKNFRIIICFSFIISWLLKSILVSGCLFYPINATCYEKLNFYDKEKTLIEANVGEAWAKGWPDKKINIDNFKDYNKNFNWLSTWSNNHFKYIVKKLTPIFIFLLILTIFIFRKKKNLNEKNYKFNNFQFISIVIISIFLCLIWFLKFPVYRFGSSFILVSLIFIYQLFVSNTFEGLEKKKISKIFSVFLILFTFGFFIKNSLRIISSINQNIESPWPDIYSEKGNFIKNEFLPIKKNSSIMYYYSNGNLCMYSKSPCSYYITPNLFLDEKYGYKIYFKKK